MQSAVEEFAQQLAKVIRRFLKAKTWRDTDAIVVGGGFRASRVGELAIGRSAVILKAEGAAIDIELIRHDPDEAGCSARRTCCRRGCWQVYDAMLAVDVGGTNIRAGVVELNLKKAKDLSEAAVMHSELWRHGDEDAKRDDAVERLVEMLQALVKEAKKSQASPGARRSASAAPASSTRTVPSSAARRTCPATGKAAASICRAASAKRFPRSATMRR